MYIIDLSEKAPFKIISVLNWYLLLSYAHYKLFIGITLTRYMFIHLVIKRQRNENKGRIYLNFLISFPL